MGKETFTLGLFGFKTGVLRGLDPIKCVCVHISVFGGSGFERWIFRREQPLARINL